MYEQQQSYLFWTMPFQCFFYYRVLAKEKNEKISAIINILAQYKVFCSSRVRALNGLIKDFLTKNL